MFLCHQPLNGFADLTLLFPPFLMDPADRFSRLSPHPGQLLRLYPAVRINPFPIPAIQDSVFDLLVQSRTYTSLSISVILVSMLIWAFHATLGMP